MKEGNPYINEIVEILQEYNRDKEVYEFERDAQKNQDDKCWIQEMTATDFEKQHG